MVMQKGAKNYLTQEEYFAFEEKSPIKHHYINGKLYPMPGGTPNHNLIAARITAQLIFELDKKEDKEYFVLNSDTKIDIPRFNSYVYPDAVVVCEKIELKEGRKDVIINPLLIVEVASPSTENYDSSDKLTMYKSIPTLEEYVTVAQRMPYIMASYKKEKHLWQDTVAEDLNDSIYLQSLDISIPLNKIYRGVNFED